MEDGLLRDAFGPDVSMGETVVGTATSALAAVAIVLVKGQNLRGSGAGENVSQNTD